MIAGMLFGICEALITATLGSSYTQILSFALVIVVLALRPNGLFGRAAVHKV
jgi:branched-chain amino acid transport system permease protein